MRELALSREDLLYGIATIWGESRGEAFEGKQAVAHVLLNRVADNRWPRTLREVATQRRQFSCWNEDDPNRPKILEVIEYLEDAVDDQIIIDCATALTYAAVALEDDVTFGANHYWADWIDTPKWARGHEDKFLKIGKQTFLKL